MNSGYTYGGSPEEEASRLAKQAQSFKDQDLPILRRFGLQPGQNVLDVGCGPGTVTVEIAREISPTQVIGIDRDEGLLTQARHHASQLGITNVEYIQQDITAPNLPEAGFDFVYCRFLLWAIPKRQQALHNMIQLAKPQGIVCAQEADADSRIYWPPLPAHERYWHGRIKYHQDRQDGIDPAFGKKLYSLFLQAKLVNIKVGVSALYKEHFTWDRDAETHIGSGADALHAGYITQEDLQEIAEWAKDPLAFIMFSTVIVAGSNS